MPVPSSSPELLISVVDGAQSTALATMRTLFDEYRTSVASHLCFAEFAAERDGLPGAYAAPGGTLLMAMHRGEAVGCVGLRALDGARGEMKRLYVRPDARGLGVGTALLTRIIEDARAIGYSELVLDTLPTMREARRLYASFGFRDIPPYGSTPVAGADCFALSLTSGPTSD